MYVMNRQENMLTCTKEVVILLMIEYIIPIQTHKFDFSSIFYETFFTKHISLNIIFTESIAMNEGGLLISTVPSQKLALIFSYVNSRNLTPVVL